MNNSSLAKNERVVKLVMMGVLSEDGHLIEKSLNAALKGYFLKLLDNCVNFNTIIIHNRQHLTDNMLMT